MISKFSETVKWIEQNIFKIIVITIVVTPSIYLVIEKVYSERINVLQERINLFRDRIEIIEQSRDYFEKKTLEYDVNSLTKELNLDLKTASQKVSLENKIKKPFQKVSKGEVYRIAASYGLFDEIPPNLHLKFKEGEISYWYEQNLNIDQLKLEFESRKIVLERAKKQNKIIETQGDFSYWAESIQGEILQNRRQ